MPATAELGCPDLARLFEVIDHCVLVHDAGTKDILWANPAARTALGFTLDELKPLKAPDMSSNAAQYARHIGVAWLQRAADQGRSRIEWCYRSKSGTDILSEALAVRVELSAGPVVMVQFRDIAEEKATRRDLTRTEARLQAFLRNLDEGIVVLDDDGRILFAGESAGSLLDRDPDDMLGTDFTTFLAADSTAVLRGVLHDTPRGGRPTDARYRLAASDSVGPDRWFAARCQYIDIENDLRGLLLLFHDITDTVHTEEEHRRDAQYLNQLARHNAMGDMAMAIAHEVSQPIAAAHNFVAGTLGRVDDSHEAPDPLRWGLDHATRQLERATTILSSLRAYVLRLEDAKRSVDLNDVVADCRYFVDVRAKAHRVAVRWEHTTDDLPVSCEKVLIGQVVMNLAFNALEEMARWPENPGPVTITTRRHEDRAEVEVRDTGGGLPTAPGDRIFDGAFTSKGNGHGIGLALSHRIISRHDGHIEAFPNSPRGAVFRFRLPLLPGL
ncbi:MULTISPECIES: ATP-binding protein [unclassified Streptomyces]|uniref:ATP-binding protein n=1 Tax=unclassified Streptomyces TaxID=2593676 RepID=UPI00278C2EF8|nr:MULTISPECIES: ATP-binding protein [unclassified Streptomyces]